MQKKPLILFDLDGVLVDTALLHFNAWKKMAAEYGLSIGPETERKLRGLSREMSFHAVFSGHAEALENRDEICAKKNRQFLNELKRLPPTQILVPRVKELLQGLKTAGASLVIASGSRNARAILDSTGLTPFFEAIVDGSIETEKKPDPQYYRNLLSQFGVSAQHTLLFEDSGACIAAAHGEGIRTVAVNCPPEVQATLHIKNLEKLSSASTLELIQS